MHNIIICHNYSIYVYKNDINIYIFIIFGTPHEVLQIYKIGKWFVFRKVDYIMALIYWQTWKTLKIQFHCIIRIEPIQFEPTGCLAAQARSLLLLAQASFSCATIFQLRNTARGLSRLCWRLRTHVAESCNYIFSI